MQPFGKHAREFARALDAREYQRTNAGILFPRHGALLAGAFAWSVRNRAGRLIDGGRQHNLLTSRAIAVLRNGLLPVGSGHEDPFPLYVCLWGGNVTPAVDWTDYYLAVVAQELGDAPEGYTEVVRQNWTRVNLGAGVVSNTGVPAAFTIATASTLTVYGYAIVETTNAKQSGAADTTPFDVTTVVTEIPDLDQLTIYGRQITVGADTWYDPDGNDVWDGGLGHWTDPGADGFQIVANYTTFAIARTGPTVHNNADAVSVTYELTLST